MLWMKHQMSQLLRFMGWTLPEWRNCWNLRLANVSVASHLECCIGPARHFGSCQNNRKMHFCGVFSVGKEESRPGQSKDLQYSDLFFSISQCFIINDSIQKGSNISHYMDNIVQQLVFGFGCDETWDGWTDRISLPPSPDRIQTLQDFMAEIPWYWKISDATNW